VVVIFGLLTYIGKAKMQKNKPNTVPNRTTNPNPTIDESGNEKKQELNKLH